MAFRLTNPRLKATAAQAASHLLENFNTTTTRSQFLDANQLQKLSLTLGRPTLSGIDVSSRAPPPGTPIPPGYHLVYFTPNGLESELGADGSDKTYNAPDPFSRRMWAGGKMKWTGELKVGEEAEERTRLVSATAKKSKSAGELILVEVQKEIETKSGKVADTRSWVFRPVVEAETVKMTSMQGPTTIQDVKDGSGLIREYKWSPVGLFRFSALTFNAHKIHYNEAWTAGIEGHPGVVVHGPLNLICSLDYWKDVNQRLPTEVAYRAMAPVYSGDEYKIRADGDAVVVQKQDTICMKADIQ